MWLRDAGEPRSIQIDCDGTLCSYRNIVVNPEIVGFGERKVGIVGEAPWRDEILLKRPFVGTSGLLLRGYFDYDNYRYFIVNSTCCVSFDGDEMIKPSDMKISDYMVRLENCRKFREKVFDLLDDESVIVVFGNYAKLAMFGMKVSTSPFPRIYRYKNKKFYIFANYHPAYLVYKPSSREMFEWVLRSTCVFKLEDD